MNDEQPHEALLLVLGVAAACILLVNVVGLFISSAHTFPCSYTKIEGFNKVSYRALCEVE